MNLKKHKFDIYDLEGRLFDENFLTIHLILTNTCNQNCSYCLCKTHPDNINVNTEFSIESFNRVVDFVKKQERNSFEFYFFGGEPTTHSKIKYFSTLLEEKFKEKLKRIVILTNLKKELEFYKEFGEKTYFVASIHTDQVKDWDSWFIKAIKLKDNISLLKLVLTENNLDDVIYLTNKYRKYFSKKQFQIQAIYQLDDKYLSRVESKLHEDLLVIGSDTENLFDKNTYISINDEKVGPCDYKKYERYNNFMGMMCAAGFWIMENGDVVKCSSDITKNKKPLLNIFKDDIRKLDKWGLCTNRQCNCEEGIPKVSIKKYLKLFKN